MSSYGPTIPAGRPGADRSERPPSSEVAVSVSAFVPAGRPLSEGLPKQLVGAAALL